MIALSLLELILREEGFDARSDALRELREYAVGWRTCPSCGIRDLHDFVRADHEVECSKCAARFPDPIELGSAL